MRKANVHTVISGLLTLFLLVECNKEEPPILPREGVEVEMNGSLKKTVSSRAQIIPNNGLPDEQLGVAIVTVNYRTSDPENVQPDLAAWRGSTADITPGYFGGPGLGAIDITTGEIKYTNEDGTMVQKVFYDETGEHYFVRIGYPYDNAEFIQSDRGAALVFSDIDGSQDILCSNLGWGNIDNPLVITDEPDSVIVFSHMLSLFRIKIVPENEVAAYQYGTITNIRLADQPGSVKIDMIDLAMEAYTAPDTVYYSVGFDPVVLSVDDLGTPVAEEAGYIMAMPGRKFTIEAETENRLWISADFYFTTPEDPFRTSESGKMYNITVKFMEGYEMTLDVHEDDEWWIDSEFN